MGNYPKFPLEWASPDVYYLVFETFLGVIDIAGFVWLGICPDFAVDIPVRFTSRIFQYARSIFRRNEHTRDAEFTVRSHIVLSRHQLEKGQ